MPVVCIGGEKINIMNITGGRINQRMYEIVKIKGSKILRFTV